MPIAIRSSITTTADDADAIVFSSADRSVQNYATILTLGDRADAVRGTGDRLQVGNAGQIETRGDGAAAITLAGNDAKVTNDGIIQVGGFAIFSDDAPPLFADAISVRGDRFDLLNRGSIRIGSEQSPASDNAGLSGVGDRGSIRNAGSITAVADYVLALGVSGSNDAATNDGVISIKGVAGLGLAAFGGTGDRLLNRGSVQMIGDGSVALLLAGPDGTAENRGSTTLQGTGVYALFGQADGATLTNAGRVTVASDVGADDPPIASAGMVALGNATTIINDGQITTAGRFAVGITAGDGSTRVENNGSVETRGDYSSGIRIGVVAPDDLASSDALVRNTGSIRTIGDASAGVLMIGDDNAFVNVGRIETKGGVGSEGLLGPLAAAGVLVVGDNVLVTNERTGSIVATNRASPAVVLNAIDVDGVSSAAATTTLANRGLVSGTIAVLGGDASEHVVNAGLIRGDIDLDGGADRFVAARGGRLEGTLTLGAGDDLVVVEREAGRLVIADFVTGTGSDDVLDVSALGFRNLADVTASARQLGSDVFIQSSGGSSVLLEHVLLTALRSDDFVFSPASGAMA